MVGLVAACTSVDCSEYGRVVCTYEVLDYTEDKDTLPNLFSATIKTLEDGSDTTLINLKGKTTSFSLPMSYSLATDTLIFTLNDTTGGTRRVLYEDKVYITKTNTPYFEGYDCAPRYMHEITKAWSTHHFIDTLYTNNSSVRNNAAATNILIKMLPGF